MSRVLRRVAVVLPGEQQGAPGFAIAEKHGADSPRRAGMPARLRRFLLSTGQRGPVKNRFMRTPDLADRLSAAREAKKALLERAKAIAESPERAERRKARQEIVAARNARMAERKAAE
jgi:hypothetical protein